MLFLTATERELQRCDAFEDTGREGKTSVTHADLMVHLCVHHGDTGVTLQI